MHFAFVDVVASSIIGTQFEARIAAAFVGAPIIYTAMLTQARILLALVHINAFSIVARLIFETRFAVATVRADAVDALSVRRTGSAILVKFTLVDVLTVAVVGRHKAGGTNAGVAAGFVFARLLRSTNGLSRCALINIDALTTISIQLKTSLACHRIKAAVGAVHVDTLLAARARHSHLALIYIFFFSATENKSCINERKFMQEKKERQPLILWRSGTFYR